MYKAPEQKGFSFRTLAIQCHYLSAEMHFVLLFSLGTPLFTNWEMKSQIHELLGSLLLQEQVPGLPWALCNAPNRAAFFIWTIACILCPTKMSWREWTGGGKWKNCVLFITCCFQSRNQAQQWASERRKARKAREAFPPEVWNQILL